MKTRRKKMNPRRYSPLPRSLISLLPPLSLLNKLSRSLLNLSSQQRRSKHPLPPLLPPSSLLNLRSKLSRKSQSPLSLNQMKTTMRKITMMRMMMMLMTFLPATVMRMMMMRRR